MVGLMGWWLADKLMVGLMGGWLEWWVGGWIGELMVGLMGG